METNKILTADILDLIFEGRYKEYGAYELRKTYNKRIKAGLIGMVKSVGKEYATSGITINAMAPALIESPMSASFSESQMTALKSKIPMERLGKGQEVADLTAWIISPACSFTTGFTFDLSGGRATY